MIPRLFVYGTLRPGSVAYGRVLAPYAHTCRPAVLPDHALYAVGLPYPAVVPKTGYRVVGDLVELDQARVADALTEADFFEGVGYRRDLVMVEVGSRTVDAWVYLAVEPASLPADALVPSGDWRDVR